MFTDQSFGVSLYLKPFVLKLWIEYFTKIDERAEQGRETDSWRPVSHAALIVLSGPATSAFPFSPPDSVRNRAKLLFVMQGQATPLSPQAFA